MVSVTPQFDPDELVFGLDIGTNSVGWAVARYKTALPVEVLSAGSRVFEAGMEGSVTQGKEESRNKKRRDARLQRRSLWRRRRRKSKTYRMLSELGLLPPCDPRDPDSLHEAIEDVDAKLRAELLPEGDHRAAQLLPYIARARSATEPVPPLVLGRALYHLAQRRGFLSNRKAPMKDSEDLGSVKTSIRDLEAAIEQSGCETLGQYFSTLNPTDERIRSRWTGRAMFEHEFETIMRVQKEAHACLTDDAISGLRKALFYQRPLRSQKHLVGRCELERDQRRCHMALFEFQRFRLLQAVNHLQWCPHDGEDRPLEPHEREKLIEALENEGDRTFGQIRTLLGLKARAGKFNLEYGGEKRLCGNRTNAKLRSLFEERWDEFSRDEKEAIVQDLLSIQNVRALETRAKRRWGLPADRARILAEDSILEDDYASHSLRALQKLLPHMEAGLAYSEARKAAYPDSFESEEPLDRLPPVQNAGVEIRNPTVMRTLTEVRGVVNALLARYGKPGQIRIELARDIKQPKRRRQEVTRRMRAREKQREAARKRILDKAGIQKPPSRRDIDKILLADECGWQCPYTGRSFGIRDLFGPTPQIDIEHILPFSRCLDDSFLNKTLCESDENRRVKGNRTPYEAYAGRPEVYSEILARVERFHGDPFLIRQKLDRFKLESLGSERIDDFSERQLADTRYASRMAADYVGLLYGGRTDESGTIRIQVSAGQATAILRNAWGMNPLLGDTPTKSRNDHRHHALDAIVVALTGPREVKQIAEAAKRASNASSHRRFEGLELPWKSFRTDVAELIQGIITSRRPTRKLRGALHEETNYSRLLPPPSSQKSPDRRPRIRKPLSQLGSEADLEKIADPVVRERVKRRFAEIAGLSDKKIKPDKAFEDPANHPWLENADGSRTPIHRVRIFPRVKRVVTIGRGPSTRYVAPGSNHHMAIVAVLDRDGNEIKWEGHVVTLLEAAERCRNGEDVVQRDWGEGKRFKFSLSSGDCVGRNLDSSRVEILHVKGVSEGVVECLAINDARPATEVRKEGVKAGRYLASPNRLRTDEYRRIVVDRLGEITLCHE